jgi:steroid 5-alpha reductase family enzyme
MYAPGLFTLTQASTGGLWLPIGVVIMLAGLVLEAAADAQKSRLKEANPSRVVSEGLFAIVRSPN